MSLTKWFARVFNWSAPQRPRPQGFNTFILEPILTPSGLVDSPVEDTPDLDLVGDSDIPDLDDSPPDESDIDVDNINDSILDDDLDDIPFSTDDPLTPKFDKGVFTVGDSGKVSIDFLYDGGGYKGQLAIFSLEGMEDLEGEAFIQEAASRALSNSTEGYIVIDDASEGARFSGRTAWEGDFNSGQHIDPDNKVFEMRAGDTFGIMLVPNGTVEQVANNPNIGGSIRPLFSMETANPEDAFHVGQIADVTGDGNTFVMEDLRVDRQWTDQDYNDIIFQIKGATGEAVDMDDVIDPAKDWRDTDWGQDLITYVTPEETEPLNQELTPVPPAWKLALERASNLDNYDPEALAATRQWLVNIPEGQQPEELARSIGAKYIGESGHIPDTYILEFSEELSPIDVADQLNNTTDVEFYVPLVAQETQKDFIPNDEFFNLQWHLQNKGTLGGTPGADANVTTAWDSVRGTGVVIGIIDDALEHTHEDLDDNYRADLSWDFKDNDSDPSPESSDESHGTGVAGIAAAEGNNGIGVSGAAPEASIAGLRLIGQPTYDSTKANALSYQNQDIDIYQNSWSPGSNKNPINLLGPGISSLAAMETGVNKGRGGLGNIYVFSAGNNRERKFNKDGKLTHFGSDNVNNNGYANSRFTIAVGAIDDRGIHSSYSEPGAALFVSAYSNGNSRQPTATTDLSGSSGTNGLKNGNWADTQDYTFFGGTSSAAPLVSGVIALMLDANPNLTWRDVQHIIAKTARKTDPTHSDWSINDAGYNINHFYGFGAIDASAAVNAAKTWTTVSPEISHTTGEMKVNTTIPDNSSGGVSRIVNINQDIQLESVEVVFDATHPSRGDLEVVLVSPSGTKSILAEKRPDAEDDYDRWVFNTVRNWGESSKGTWKLQVSDKSSGNIGTWDSWQLNFYGTAQPIAKPSITISASDAAAGEPGNNGELTVTRSGSTAAPITINYSVSGSATAGSDYSALTGSVTIPAGSATAKIPVNVLDDLLVEGNETVVVTLSSSNDYELGSVKTAIVNITSDDIAKSTISVTTSDSIASETEWWQASNPARFTINRSGGDNSKAETIYYNVTGTASNGSDYTYLSGVATIPAGASSTIVNINPINDAIYEGTETVTFKVSNNSNYNLGSTTTGTAWIYDNDSPPKSTISVTTSDSIAQETEWWQASNPARFTINRSGGDNSKAETVYYNVTGTASNGSDYTYLSGVATIPAGASSTVVNINPINDAIYEGTETVTFKVSNNSNYNLGSTTTGTAWIYDNDSPPKSTISVTTSDSVASETEWWQASNPARFTINRSGGDNSKAETIYYNVTGTASNGSDYTYLSGVATIPAGASSTVVNINPINDAIYEGTETVTFKVSNNSNYNLGSTTTGTAWIYDNDSPPKSTISVTTSDSVASETEWWQASNPARFTINRSGGDNSKAETVYYNVTGTASNGSDYTYLSGVATIPAGASSTIVNINPINDAIYEGTETVTFKVSNNSNYNLGSTTTGTAWIYDNDSPPPKSLYGVTWTGKLVEIDEVTGAATTIDSLSFGSLNALAVDSQGNLFTIPDADASVGSLIKIDPATGQGNVHTTFNNNFNGVKASVRDLAFAPDGTLYGVYDEAGVKRAGTDGLFKMNTNTGEVTLIGSTGLSVLQSLTFAPNGTLYSWDYVRGLITIDPSTGQITDVSSLGADNVNIQDIAFAPDGTLYGVGSIGGAANQALYKIDVNTGEASFIGYSNSDARGIAFA